MKNKSPYFWLKLSVVAVFLFIFLGSGTLSGIYFLLNINLPKIDKLEDYKPPVVTSVFSDDGRKIGEFYRERRVVIPLSVMPDNLINAFVAAEDSRFWDHPGIDIFSMGRAFIENIHAGDIVEGGSTITQQVAKSFFLTPERTYKRKLREVFLAYKIDKKFSKEEILYLYLNQIYLGHGAYGVEAASQNYFGKNAKNLSLAECTMIAGLPPAPSRYSPFKYYNRAKQRQIYVLERMVQEGYISVMEATEAVAVGLEIKPVKNWFLEKAPYYTEYVRQHIEKKFGKKALYEEGLQIHTAVNLSFQQSARQAVKKGLEQLDKRIGFRGPIRNIPLSQTEKFCRGVDERLGGKPLEKQTHYEAIVIDCLQDEENVLIRVGNIRGVIRGSGVTWARKPDPQKAYYETKAEKISDIFRSGDVIHVMLAGNKTKDDVPEFTLYQAPLVQGALLCIEAETGHVKAMIGGSDFEKSQFNRAVQAKRQPGSAFKPIIFAAAIDKGYTPASVIIDSPIVYEDQKRDFIWKPANYEKMFYGPTLLREALVKSRNVVTVKILKDIGIDYTIDYAKQLGITSKINQDLSIGLGSSSVSLIELVNAYSVFSNHGDRIEPVFITKVFDRENRTIQAARFSRKKVLNESTAYIMTNMLEGVVQSGTGKRAKVLERPIAGKTGTTNDFIDAWFIGYSPRYTTGVWVGKDKGITLGKGETGARAAIPIWLSFMKEVLKNEPKRVFSAPEDIVFTKIDAHTGLLPGPSSKQVYFECFKEGTQPTKISPNSESASDRGEFYKEGL
jgi:penicillin-binding protein 1A